MNDRMWISRNQKSRSDCEGGLVLLPMTRSLRRWLGGVRVAGILAIAITVSGGCLFDTRDPAIPGERTGTPLTPLDNPTAIFPNLTTGVEELGGANYESALAENFVFSPLQEDSLDQALAPDIYTGWTKDIEMDVLRTVLSDADSMVVDFEPEEEISQNDFVRYRVTYELRFVPRDNSGAVTFRGAANFDVRRSSAGVWQLEFWDEIAPGENARSWGYLRGTTRQRLEG